jgi:hypothetical protein
MGYWKKEVARSFPVIQRKNSLEQQQNKTTNCKTVKIYINNCFSKSYADRPYGIFIITHDGVLFRHSIIHNKSAFWIVAITPIRHPIKKCRLVNSWTEGMAVNESIFDGGR